MIIIDQSTPFSIRWSIRKGTSNVAEDFTTALLKVFLLTPDNKVYVEHELSDDGDVIILDIDPEEFETGAYGLSAVWIKDVNSIDGYANDKTKRCYSRVDNVFAVTANSAEATNIGENQSVIVKSQVATYGYDGLNAYEMAVINGLCDASENEWLATKLGQVAVTSDFADKAVTTAKIADKAVTTAKIADVSVTSEKIADSAVGGAHISQAAVRANHIANSAVTSTHLSGVSNPGGASVTTAKIADGAVTMDKIATTAVTSVKIANDAVTSSKIKDGAVTTDKIVDDAVTSDKIATKTVTAQQIADGAVTTDKIQDVAIASSNIADGNVTTAKIAGSAVTTAKIKDGAVTTEKIANGAVDTTQIKDDAVTTAKIKDGAVSTGNITDDAVTSDKIANASVTETKIADGAVTADKIADGNITERKIADGTLTADMLPDTIPASKIADSAIGTSKIEDSAITTDKIASQAVTGKKIGTGAITREKIGDGEVTSSKLELGAVITSKLADGAVVTAKIADGAVGSVNIADGAVSTAKLSANSVNAIKIQDGAVSEVKLSTNAVTPTKIADSAVTTEKIANGAVETVKIADGAVTNDKLALGAITDDKIADGALATFETEQSERLTDLAQKVDDISVEVIESADDDIIITDDDDNVVGTINADGANFKNLKSNNVAVLTSHQDISGKADKSEVDALALKTANIENEEISQSLEESIDICNDDESETYAIADVDGLKSKGYYFLDGEKAVVRGECEYIRENSKESIIVDTAERNKLMDFMFKDLESSLISSVISDVAEHNSPKRFLNIVFITDTHQGGGYSKKGYSANRSIALFNRLANNTLVDVVCHGGDICCDYGTSHASYMAQLRNALSLFNVSKPFLIAKGNHDYNKDVYCDVNPLDIDWDNNTYYVRDKDTFGEFNVVTKDNWDYVSELYVKCGSDRYITDAEFSQISMRHANGIVKDTSNPNGGYYYLDIADYNIRLIVLNDYMVNDDKDYNSSSQIGTQLKWFCEKALDTPVYWNVLIVQHIAFETIVEAVCNKYIQIINAYKGGLSISGEHGGKSYSADYSGKTGCSFIGNIHGHEHRYKVDTTYEFNDIGFTIATKDMSNFGTNNMYGLDVLTIDTDSKVVYDTCVGADNRIFNY